MQSKLFWLLQLGYTIIPIIHLATIIIIAPNIYRVRFDDVSLLPTLAIYQHWDADWRSIKFFLFLEGIDSGRREKDGVEEKIWLWFSEENGTEFDCLIFVMFF